MAKNRVEKAGANGERRHIGVGAEARWIEILDAAGVVFQEKGYEGASLQDIADRVGLLKGSMYYYIRTKEDLLLALVNTALDEFAPTTVEDEALAAAGAAERLRGFIQRWMTVPIKSREWNVVAEREFTRLSSANLRAVIKRRDAVSVFVKGVIKQGVDDGAFDPDVDLSVATTAVFELMNSTHLWHRPGLRLGLAELGEWYATFIIRGLGGPRWVSGRTAPPAAKRALVTRS